MANFNTSNVPDKRQERQTAYGERYFNTSNVPDKLTLIEVAKGNVQNFNTSNVPDKHGCSNACVKAA